MKASRARAIPIQRRAASACSGVRRDEALRRKPMLDCHFAALNLNPLNCIILSNPKSKLGAMPVIRYLCPDCGREVEALTAQQTEEGCDSYEPVLCPGCRQLHSVSAANGEFAAEDELGDPW